MERHFTIHLNAHNDHAVLQRILLAFSRRRLRVRALQFFDLHEGKAADMQIDVDCTPAHARDVMAQLAAIVEVTRVWADELEPGAAAGGQLAAA